MVHVTLNQPLKVDKLMFISSRRSGGKSWTHPTQGWDAGDFLVPNFFGSHKDSPVNYTPILPFLFCQFINQKQRLQAQSRVIASNVRRFYRRALQELNVDPRRNDGTWKCWQKIWWIVNNHFGDAKRQVLGQEDVVKIFGTKGGECLFWKAAEDDLWIEKWNRTFHLGPGKQLCIKNRPGQAFVRVMEAWVSKKRKKDVQAFKRSIFIH